jgi:hypothetical protein
MTQEQFTNLTAMAAVGLAPVMLTTAGHVSADRLKELAEAAANLAQELSKAARIKYQAASGALWRSVPPRSRTPARIFL